MKIEHFDKANIKAFVKDIDKAINEVCKEWGMNPTGLDRGSYSPKTFSSKIEFNISRPDLNPSIEPERFFGRRFKSGGRVFTIRNGNDFQFPGKLIGETERGKRYFLTVEQLLKMREL